MQKFENVDILKSLKAIMQTHTEHFQSDFDIDVKVLKQAAKSPNPEDKKYLYFGLRYHFLCAFMFVSKKLQPAFPARN